MNPTRSGYSGKSVAEKLGIKTGQRASIWHAPEDYWALIEFDPTTLLLMNGQTDSVDVLHGFVNTESELRAQLKAWSERIRPNGMLWISWPKKSSGVVTDLSENTIRDAALALGLVDVKVCAVSPVWSGLKLVWRRRKQ